MRLFLPLLLLFTGSLQAAIDVYQFDSEQDAARFKQLTNELRCPKCQNQNIADSNAEIALDLRKKIHDMLGSGKTNDEIVAYMVERYGDFVHYEPPIDSQTYILWYGPVLLLLIGILTAVWIARRSSAQTKAGDIPLDNEQQQQLDELLKDRDNHND